MTKQLPRLDVETGINHSPHVVILGAGASVACCPYGDANGLRLPVMNDVVSVLSLEAVIDSCGLDPDGDFEDLYSDIYERKLKEPLDIIDNSVRKFFGSIQLPSEITLYDKLVLGLRPKDIIASFNWDPLLPQAFRRWRHLGHNLPNLVFLHGNVEVKANDELRTSKFCCDITEQDTGYSPSRLLYPIKEKDYNSDPFISAQWTEIEKFLERAYLVTVIGYSAPKTDVEAKELLLKAWYDNPTRTLAEFSVIDIARRDIVESSWKDFRTEDVHSSIFLDFSCDLISKYPRRSCDAFAHATLQQRPWHEDPYPENITLAELEKWIKPLLEEERLGKFEGKPHHKNVN